MQPERTAEEAKTEKKTEKSGTAKAESEAQLFQTVKEAYNQAVAATRLPMIKAMTDSRKGAVRARAKEYGLEAVAEAIAKAAASDFLSGDNQRGFVATFDWIFRPNNFPKVLEGNYDNSNTKPKTRNQNGNNQQPGQVAAPFRGGSPQSGDDGGYERRAREFEAHIRAKLAAPDPETQEIPF